MKQFVAVGALCATFSVSAFAVLVTVDRQLGLPLPYSVSMSLGVVSIAAPLMFAIANAVRVRRPVVIRATPAPPRPAPRIADTPAARRRAQGFVLLDCSTAKKLQVQAA